MLLLLLQILPRAQATLLRAPLRPTASAVPSLVSLMARGYASPVGDRIKVKNPVVEIDGDEMTRIIWKKIREEVS